jgi:hypothetical protein
MADRLAYRKLPGRRRGFLKGASVWLGADHLLLVKSVRFREEYKRYQLRDIQAVAIARRPRFHISTRAFGIAILWLIAYFFIRLSRIPRGTTLLWAVAIALTGAWIYISAARSCTCRIYTAVSRDELPSVYRTWVAGRFLRAVEPEIAAVQGAVDGAWADAVGNQTVGPRESALPGAAQPGFGPDPNSAAHRFQATPFYFLLAALFLDALIHGLGLYYSVLTGPRVSNLLALLLISVATFVLVQYHRGKVRAAEQRLAIAALVAMGLLYYVRLTVVGAVEGARATLEKRSIALDYTGGPVASKIEMGITLVLGLVGLVILIAGHVRSEGPKSIPS